MFRGNHPTRVDEKGRLKVPAEFKRVLDEKYSQQFYITSFDGKSAQMYPFEEWERLEEKFSRLSTFNPTIWQSGLACCFTRAVHCSSGYLRMSILM